MTQRVVCTPQDSRPSVAVQRCVRDRVCAGAHLTFTTSTVPCESGLGPSVHNGGDVSGLVYRTPRPGTYGTMSAHSLRLRSDARPVPPRLARPVAPRRERSATPPTASHRVSPARAAPLSAGPGDRRRRRRQYVRSRPQGSRLRAARRRSTGSTRAAGVPATLAASAGLALRQLECRPRRGSGKLGIRVEAFCVRAPGGGRRVRTFCPHTHFLRLPHTIAAVGGPASWKRCRAQRDRRRASA